MAGSYHFKRKTPDDLIVVPALIENRILPDNFNFAIDTGASHTVVDLNLLLLIETSLEAAIETVYIRTGKGVVEAKTFEIPAFTVLGLKRERFVVTAYDFLLEGSIDNLAGMVGLDFFENTRLFIDFREQSISLE